MDAALIGDVIISNVSSEAFLETFSEVGKIGNWLQALGVIAVLWIVFQIVSLVLTLNKIKMLSKIVEDISKLENKIDRKLNAIDRKISKK